MGIFQKIYGYENFLMDNPWPVPTPLERIVITLIGLSSWSWAILTGLWLLLFRPSKAEWRREGNTWKRVDNANTQERR